VGGGWNEARAGFIVREQAIEVTGAPAPWRRTEVALDTPTKAGERAIRLWSNLLEEIGAQRIAALYRTRWCTEGMFQRLEAVLHSEIAAWAEPAKVPAA